MSLNRLFSVLRAVFSVLLISCSYSGTAEAAEILPTDPEFGRYTYFEDFHDPATVDAGAGPGPGLDATEIVGTALMASSGGPGSTLFGFDDPASYSFDPTRVTVDSGLARLGGLGLDEGLMGYWRMEETSWDGTFGEVVDSSGNQNDGTSNGAQLSSAGFLGNGGSFAGGSLVNLGQPALLDLQPTDEFTVSAWFKTSGNGAIVGKAVSTFGDRQFYIYIFQGRLAGNVGGVQNDGTIAGLADGQWHQGVLVNRDDAGTMRYTLYVDGVSAGTFASGAATNGADVMIGARRDSGNSGTGFPLDGLVDEVAIYDRALSPSEVADLYHLGAGRILDADGPVAIDTAVTAIPGLSAFTGFGAVLGLGNEGSVAFQLSSDGNTWQWWDGASWSVATSAAESNDDVTINSHIGGFSVGPVAVRAFLVSGGSQVVELDEISLSYLSTTPAVATEIFGPIESEQTFEVFEGYWTGDDAGHQIVFRLLSADAATPIPDIQVPGNETGLDPVSVAQGVYLGNVPAGAIYVEASFINTAGDNLSVALEEFWVTFTAPQTQPDIATGLSDAADPARRGDQLEYTVRLANEGDAASEPTRLGFAIPEGTIAGPLVPASGWTCYEEVSGSFECTGPSLAAGQEAYFQFTANVPTDFAAPEPLVASAFADDFNDPNPDNDLSQVTTTLEQEPVRGTISVSEVSSPADGTDFAFDGVGLSPFTLDDASPDDGDGVSSSALFTLLAAGPYSISQSPVPPPWQLDAVVCNASGPDGRFDVSFAEAFDYSYDSAHVLVDNGLARLRRDTSGSVVGHWRFEELWTGVAGEVADSSGSGLHGVAEGGAQTVANGLLGRAGSFAGGSLVNLGQPAALDFDPASDEFTVAAWFRTQGAGAIVAKAVDTTGDRQFYLFTLQGRLWVNVGGVQSSGNTSGLDDGAWHHAVVVGYDDAGTRRHDLYLDGQLELAGVASGSATNDADILIGARRAAGNAGTAFALDGEVDEVAMFERALSSVDVASLYGEGVGKLVGGYALHGPQVVHSAGFNSADLAGLSGFQAVYGPGNQGVATFQLSNDGTIWRYWDGSAWSVASGGEANDAATVDANIQALDITGSASLFVRSQLISDGSQRVELDHLRITWHQLGSSWLTPTSNGASIDLVDGVDVSCQFQHSRASTGASLTVELATSVADGTDFAFVGDAPLTSFSLDQANPDDGDGISSSLTFNDLTPGRLRIEQMVPAGWSLDHVMCVDQSALSNGDLVAGFEQASDYSYDPQLIEVTSGSARLRDLFDGYALLGYWRFEDGGWDGTPGEVTDLSGNDFHGVAVGDSANQQKPYGGASGIFDGSSDYLDFGQPAALDLDPASQEFTVSAWFRTTGDGAIVAKAVTPQAERQFYLYAFQDRLWANIGGQQNGSQTAPNVSDGQWHHGAVVNYDAGGSMRYSLYVDGTFQGDFASGAATNESNVLVGARRNTGNTGTGFGLQGEVDEVAIFGRAFDAGEIADLYSNGEGVILERYNDNGPAIDVTFAATGATALTSFTARVGSPEQADELAFQLSNDGVTWLYWSGEGWAPATLGQDSPTAAVSSAIGSFPYTGGDLFVRMYLYLASDSGPVVDALELGITAPPPAPVPYSFEPITHVLWVDLVTGDDVRCTFDNQRLAGAPGSILTTLSSAPQDGTNVTFSLDGNAFVLDDAMPDDGDSVHDNFDFTGLATGQSYRLSLTSDVGPAAGWFLHGSTCSGASRVRYLDYDSSLVIDLVDGEEVSCSFDVRQSAPTDLVQTTDTVAGIEQNGLAADAQADTLAFSSTDDPLGTNSDGNEELFLLTSGGYSQITDSTIAMAVEGAPRLSADGRWLVFAATTDPLFTNGDGNAEIFLRDNTDGSLLQLSDTTACANQAPSVDDAGRVAWLTDCSDLVAGFNADANSEAVLWQSGSYTVAETSDCLTDRVSLARQSSEPLLSFVSTCDLASQNPSNQIRLFQWAPSGGGMHQLAAGLDAVGMTTPSVSDNGRFVAFSARLSLPGPTIFFANHLYRLDTWSDELTLIDYNALFAVYDSVAVDNSGRHVMFTLVNYLTDVILLPTHVDLLDPLRPVKRRYSRMHDVSVALVEATDPADMPTLLFISREDFLGSNTELNDEVWAQTLRE